MDEEDPFFSEKVEVDTALIDQRIFGFSLFNNEHLTFEPSINIAVSDSYLLGVGDEIIIDVWGSSEQSYQLVIDRNGGINLPGIGIIHLGGMKLDKAREKVMQKLQLIYSDLSSQNPKTFASLNLGQIKAINVNVVGEVFAPGTYTIPGTASAFNVMYLCGGPNTEGSFREIKVIRKGEEIHKLDVYSYLIDGKTDENINLNDGDVILVPPYLNRIFLEGEVKRKGIFEGKPGEVVDDLLRFSGGFNENAYTHRLELFRKTGRDMVFKDVFKEQFSSMATESGDSIWVGKINDRFQNRVTIEGAVYRPGNYELTEGLKLSDLLAKADGLKEDAFVERGLVTRVSKDLSLQSEAFDVL